MDKTQDTRPSEAPDHELIRLEAAAHPERSYREHVEVAIAIAGRTYAEDLRRIQRREDKRLNGILGD